MSQRKERAMANAIIHELGATRLAAIGEALGAPVSHATDRDRRVSLEIAELLMEPETTRMSCQTAHEIFRQYCTDEDRQNVFFGELPSHVQELEHVGLVALLNKAVELQPDDKRLRRIRSDYTVQATMDALIRAVVRERMEGSEIRVIDFWGNLAEQTLARFLIEWKNMAGDFPNEDLVTGMFERSLRSAAGSKLLDENVIKFPSKR